MEKTVARAKQQGLTFSTPMEVGVMTSVLLTQAALLITGAACAATGKRQTGQQVEQARRIAAEHQHAFATELVAMLGIVQPEPLEHADKEVERDAEPAPTRGPS